MSVEYIPHIAYPGNPFIEALPRKLSQEDLFARLSSLPEYSKEMCRAEKEYRLDLLSILSEVFVPLDYSVRLYHMIYRGMERAFLSKPILSVLHDLQGNLPPSEIKKDYSEYQPVPNNSASLLGVPGIGKTSTVARLLRLIPQVITHTEYNGVPFNEVQINYLSVECPSDYSVKALCLAILEELSAAVSEIGVPKLSGGKGDTLDSLALSLRRYCHQYRVGAIIIDEIQNVRPAANMKKETFYSNKNPLIGFLVQLINSLGVCIFFVGTPEANDFFSTGKHLFRRTRGPQLSALEYGSDYNTLLNCLWEYQFTSCYSLLTDNIRRLIYDITGGIPALMTHLLVCAQEHAILSGEECVSHKVLRIAAEEYHLTSSVPLAAKILPAGDLDLALCSPTQTIAYSSTGESIMKNEFSNISLGDVSPGDSPRRGAGRPETYRDPQDLLVLRKTSGSAENFIIRLRQEGFVLGRKSNAGN